MGLFDWLFGTYSAREIKKITPLVDKIEGLADSFHALSDDEMRGYTDRLKGELASGKTLDDILPEAFALVREADERVLGKRPYRVQLIGGILLHQGRIAEMKTGEGKTLVATLPAYLNALAGNGVHIVTVNDYLARRDSEEMGRVYAYLGLTTGLIVHGQSPDEKRKAYNADITYCTNNELGFDYLRDNMVVYKENMVQRGHAFAIVDEVDSILIDEARTPLIISGQSSKSTELYEKADALARKMTRFVIKEMDKKEAIETYEFDFVIDEKARTAVLTPQGSAKAEKYFGIENLSDPENSALLHHINTAIRAHGVMKRDTDYIVKDGAVIIVDSFTGRLMPGRRYNDGLHQAIEAKEGVEVQRESRTVATITFQNYFRMYKKLSGMTGTALTEENEFREIYRLDVVEVPTNKPMIRLDRNDAVYRTRAGKLRAIVAQIRACYEKGQPILVGTVSIEKSEELSAILKRAGIPHNVLNAKQHEREAEIVAQPGAPGAVTISTNMAGRGTDIMLGGNAEFLTKRDLRRLGYAEYLVSNANGTSDTEDEELLLVREKYNELYAEHKRDIEPLKEAVIEAGGLFILGTERHESRRIDNQLRGRSGRQGDPGESRFFLSLEDDLMRLFGSDRVMGFIAALGLDEDTAIDAKLLSGSIEGAQKRIEANNFERRKHVLTYDDVMNQQRNIIYAERHEVLTSDSIEEKITSMIEGSVRSTFDMYFAGDDPTNWNINEFVNHYRGLLRDSRGFKYSDEEMKELDREALCRELVDEALRIYHSKNDIFDEAARKNAPEGVTPRLGIMREVEKRILLEQVDRKWMDHLEALDELREYIGLNAYAQRDPVAMYRLESGEMFDAMIDDIKEDTVKNLLAVMPVGQPQDRVQVARVTSVGGGDRPKPKPIVRSEKKIGRNDPCPCGSGKKYKKCCGIGKS